MYRLDLQEAMAMMLFLMLVLSCFVGLSEYLCNIIEGLDTIAK